MFNTTAYFISLTLLFKTTAYFINSYLFLFLSFYAASLIGSLQDWYMVPSVIGEFHYLHVLTLQLGINFLLLIKKVLLDILMTQLGNSSMVNTYTSGAGCSNKSN